MMVKRAFFFKTDEKEAYVNRGIANFVTGITALFCGFMQISCIVLMLCLGCTLVLKFYVWICFVVGCKFLGIAQDYT